MEELSNLGMEVFKNQVGANSFRILRNPKTKKLFVAGDNGNTYKCQANIDVKKPVHWLINANNLEEACLINISETVETLATF